MGFLNLNLNLKVYRKWMYWLVLIVTVSFCCGDTNPGDVSAINNLYAALGSPPLTGWVQLGGDPCMEAWQGVSCVITNITEISLPNASLEGQLGTTLDSFTSMISIDLSGNHIGGTIPANLPLTMKTFNLSDNQFTGSIPDISALSQLTDLDLSGNNLSGSLPPSMGNLSSLKTLLLQDNEFTGVLDVLQDLSLRDLNVANNQFSGPVPPKLLTMPNFRGTGNPFNTTVLLSPPAASPTVEPDSPVPGDVPSEHTHKQPINVPEISSPAKSANNVITRKTILAAALVVVILLVVVFGLWFGIARWCKRRQAGEKFPPEHVRDSYKGDVKKPKGGESLPLTQIRVSKASQETFVKIPNVSNADHNQVTRVAGSKDAHSIDMAKIDVSSMSTKPVPPPRHFSNENITLKPLTPTITTTTKPVPPPRHFSNENITLKPLTPTTTTQSSSSLSSAKSFTVAELQQYTNSFSQDNLLGEGMLGSVYRGQLPDGKVLAVKKLNNTTSRQSEHEFVQLVSLISQIQHENVVELIGYCSDYGQRILVYEYCNNATLYDQLHVDEIHSKLSWSARVKIALGAARALQYLHETCQPVIVHMNFKSVNILLDDKFKPLISDCGLAPLLDSSYTAQSLSGYGAPELELGTYTLQSDVFSFGVVMLELLTGRKSYDSARPRGEQFLVRWAIPQLHDIDALSKMVDPSLQGSYPSKSLSRFADIISLCVQGEPEFRPPMSEIVQDLLNMIQREP
ncbi:protein STRUBBELIG-RECEPTOR FAMILY 3-like isoform X2 [Silene latifolia]|uniref:protein STRUBBELIG-RECEPTOR FAMILY 3-like isoform X2 n=1 Tax=Silene latifolia TaxID=37657 RepID=UPI003D7726DB